jgi:vacuolar-type H+-ATPase subunit F/Vma7
VSHTVRVLASPALAPGFRLAGLLVDEVADRNDAGERLLFAAAQPHTGILLVEQALLDAVPEQTRHEVERRAVPILVPVPAPAWLGGPSGAEDYILELLRRAIGYRVRLQ